MANKPTIPTEKQFSQFLPDQRTIKAFQLLFDYVFQDPTVSETEEIKIEAGIASARAQQALDLILIDKIFGSFFDTTDQAALTINTPVAVTFNNTRLSQGLSVSGSQINVTKTGKYSLHYTLQLED